jgi:hypothetical protein
MKLTSRENLPFIGVIGGGDILTNVAGLAEVVVHEIVRQEAVLVCEGLEAAMNRYN